MRLVYQPGGFDDAQRARILGKATVEDRWRCVLTEAFAQRNNLQPSSVPSQLGFTAKAHFSELDRLVTEHIAPLITLRNVLAHGQWSRALTSDGLKVSTERTKMLYTTRLWHLRLLRNLTRHLIMLVFDSVVTKTAFERDFDKHWADLNSAYIRLQRGNYQQWEAMLRSRYSAGRVLAGKSRKTQRSTTP